MKAAKKGPEATVKLAEPLGRSRAAPAQTAREADSGAMGRKPSRQILALVMALTGWITLPGRTSAQSVDIRSTQLLIGRALDMSFRVRADSANTTPLPPHCFHAEVVTDDQLLPYEELTLSTQRDSPIEWTRVRIRHPHRVAGTVAEVRLTLRCGPSYERIFSVWAGDEPVRSSSSRASAHHRVPATTYAGGGTTLLLANHRVQPIPADPSGPPPSPQPLPPTPDTPRLAPVELTSATASPGAQPVGVDVPGATILPASTAPTVSSATLQQNLTRLQADHEKTLSSLSALKARLAHEERSPPKLWWLVVSGLLATWFISMRRTATASAGSLPTEPKWARILGLLKQGRPRPHTPQNIPSASGDAQADTADREEAEPLAPVRGSDHPGTLASRSTSTSTSTSIGGKATRSATERFTTDKQPVPPAAPRWAHADFGVASLQGTSNTNTLLQEVEQLVGQGFPAAATITLEQALMKQEEKHPALLLALLDTYRDMGQPWNHERVSAQLEALYNVSVPPMGNDDSDADGRSAPVRHSLVACSASWDRIVRTWGGGETASALTSLLLRPTAVEVLDLSAFRDAVWLHGIATERDQAREPDAEELTLAPVV